MINLGLHARRAVVEDKRQLSNLAFHDANMHRHLDWREPHEWLGFPNYWVLEEYGRVTAALACPEDPPRVAWIRLFGHHPYLPAFEAWTAVWETARNEINNAQTQVASIVTKRWFQDLLLFSGFEIKQSIVTLELAVENLRHFSAPPNVHIRFMQNTDLSAVAKIDADVFGAFWQNTEDAIKRAVAKSVIATVAEDETGVIGYQLGAGKHPLGTHLARLAVKSEAQGRGVGAALVTDMIQRIGAARVSVNTQQDNAASLALYKKLGFIRAGESFPVLVYSTGRQHDRD